LILLLLLVPIGLGQWDMVVAVLIGLVVGNGLAFLRGK
jgi:purine-cytosine permease-like protein